MAIWYIINDANIRVAVASETEYKAERWANAIKGHFMENTRFREAYPEFCPEDPSESWGTKKGGFVVPNRTLHFLTEATVRPISVGKQLVGDHYNVIFLDDLIGDTNYNSEIKCNDIYVWMKALPNLLGEEGTGHIHAVGTRWADQDLYERLINEEFGPYDYFVRRCAKVWPTGVRTDLLYPECFTPKGLKRMEAEMGSWMFASQMLLDPFNSEESTFRDIDFSKLTIRRSELPKNVRTFALVDPAITKKRYSDSTAIVVVDVDQDDNMYVKGFRRQRTGPDELIRMICQVWKDYHPFMIAIEDVSFMRGIAHGLRLRQQELHEQYPEENYLLMRIEPISPRAGLGGDEKYMRIRALATFFESGKIKLVKGSANLGDFITQMKRHTKNTEHGDDYPDALSRILQVRSRPRPTLVVESEELPPLTIGVVRRSERLRKLAGTRLGAERFSNPWLQPSWSN
jgi:predicted phage terminase large subunit-like protein